MAPALRGWVTVVGRGDILLNNIAWFLRHVPVFGLPGVGTLTLQSISQRDYPQVQGNILILAGVFVLINLLIDLIYGWLDPRIAY